MQKNEYILEIIYYSDFSFQNVGSRERQPEGRVQQSQDSGSSTTGTVQWRLKSTQVRYSLNNSLKIVGHPPQVQYSES